MIKKIIIFVLLLSVFIFSHSIFAQESNNLSEPILEIDQAQIEGNQLSPEGSSATDSAENEFFLGIDDVQIEENLLLQEEVLLPQEEKSFITQRIVSLEQDVFSLKVFLGIIAILFGFLLLYIIMVRKKNY